MLIPACGLIISVEEDVAVTARRASCQSDGGSHLLVSGAVLLAAAASASSAPPPGEGAWPHHPVSSQSVSDICHSSSVLALRAGELAQLA